MFGMGMSADLDGKEERKLSKGMSPLANGHTSPSLMLGGVKDASTDSGSVALKGADYVPPDFQQHSLSDDEILTINVSGLRFQTLDSTLKRFPSSVLGCPHKRKRHWNAKTNEYFFDRHRQSFEAILHIYQTNGQVIRPESVPINLFLRELKFYEFDKDVMANFWESEGYQKPAEEEMPKGTIKRKVWELMEHPDSSIFARILAFVSMFVITVSIISFCLETIPELKESAAEGAGRQWSSPFFWIEFICCIWFSAELIVRFLSCPKKYKFCKSFLNLLDFIAVVPFFFNLIWVTEDAVHETKSSLSFSVLRVIRLVRVFRIFKLSRHSVGLQVLGKTFKASIQEFCLLIFFMVIALVLFSSGMYFAESNEPNSKFTSIPASFWFVMATITTVGFGDLVPTSPQGKMVGSCCALIGVLTLALPVPIIVANFKHFYRQECRLAALYVQNLSDTEEEELIRAELSQHDVEQAKPVANGVNTTALNNLHAVNNHVTVIRTESTPPPAAPIPLAFNIAQYES